MSKTVAKIVEVPARLLKEAKAQLESSIARAIFERQTYGPVVYALDTAVSRFGSMGDLLASASGGRELPTEAKQALKEAGQALRGVEELFWSAVAIDSPLGLAEVARIIKGDRDPKSREEEVRVRLLRYAVRKRLQEYLRGQQHEGLE